MSQSIILCSTLTREKIKRCLPRRWWRSTHLLLCGFLVKKGNQHHLKCLCFPKSFSMTFSRASRLSTRTKPKCAFQISEQWGIDADLWTRSWNNLSGETQRILFTAAAVALNTAEALLLDGELGVVFLWAIGLYRIDFRSRRKIRLWFVERVRQRDTSRGPSQVFISLVC